MDHPRKTAGPGYRQVNTLKRRIGARKGSLRNRTRGWELGNQFRGRNLHPSGLKRKGVQPWSSRVNSPRASSPQAIGKPRRLGSEDQTFEATGWCGCCSNQTASPTSQNGREGKCFWKKARFRTRLGNAEAGTSRALVFSLKRKGRRSRQDEGAKRVRN